jgi:hypothetical protein
MSEARTEDRLGRLEQAVGDIKAILARLEPMIVRIDATFAAPRHQGRTRRKTVARLPLGRDGGNGWGASRRLGRSGVDLHDGQK